MFLAFYSTNYTSCGVGASSFPHAGSFRGVKHALDVPGSRVGGEKKSIQLNHVRVALAQPLQARPDRGFFLFVNDGRAEGRDFARAHVAPPLQFCAWELFVVNHTKQGHC